MYKTLKLVELNLLEIEVILVNWTFFRQRTFAEIMVKEMCFRWRKFDAHSSLAVSSGAVGRAAVEWNGHSLAGPFSGHLQDRGLGASGQVVGQAEEPSRHELRQTVPLHPPVLPQGHHAQDRAVTALGLSVLLALSSANACQNSNHVQVICPIQQIEFIYTLIIIYFIKLAWKSFQLFN